MGGVLARLLGWSVRRTGTANLLLLALLLLGLGSAALGVTDRVRGVDRGLALTLSGLGMVVGWWLGLASLPPGLAVTSMALAGLLATLARVGRLGGEVLAVWWAGNGMVQGAVRWALGGAGPNWSLLWEALARLGEVASVLLARVASWSSGLVVGAPVFDPAAVSFVWGLGLWLAAAWAGRLIARRKQVLAAVTPSGILLLTAFYHVWGSHVYLLGLLLATFLLQALIEYEDRVQRWRRTKVDYPELRPQTIVVTVFLSLVLVTMAQTLPSLRLEWFTDLVPRVERAHSAEAEEAAEAVAESFGMEGRRRTAFGDARVAGLPRSHLLRAGPELSEQVVMVVRPELPDSDSGEDSGRELLSPTWRSRTYDRYTGRGWATGETEKVAYEAGVPAVATTLPTQRVVRQEVLWRGDEESLAHAAGTLMAVDHDYVVAWRSPDDLFAVTVNRSRYRADSFVPQATEQGLREDRGPYPDWVRERYLGLPDQVPDRVLALARDLSATAATRYDRARAIEIYLREFPYSLDVPTPPGDRDVVAYFLFDLKKGYCDYYASAMVVLARAAGLPARLAVGYGSGTYDADGARYVVTEADAHAWPEIYFPAYGWVRFEPTASRERVDRAAGEVGDWTEPESALEPALGWWSALDWAWWQLALVAVALGGLTAAAWRAADRWRLARREPMAAVARVYYRLRYSGRRLGVPMEPGDTPREFGAAFAGWIERPDRLRALVIDAADDVVWLTNLYARLCYSPRSPEAGDREEVLRVWTRLSRRLRLAELVQGLRRWTGLR
jgi:transglutaminase-like putative cysteine protease